MALTGRRQKQAEGRLVANNTNDFIVYHHDVKKVLACSSGTRKLLKKYGFDWQDYLKNGLSYQELLATKDGMITKVINNVKLKKGL